MAPTRIRNVAFFLAALAWLFARVDAHAAPSPNSWTWPVLGPVIRGFEPPPSRFSAGHRGIDIGTRFGTPVLAPSGGVVTFAGAVAGSLFVTIDHGDGYLSTSSYVSRNFVKKGDVVSKGQVVALSGHGHPEVPQPHLHFGVRLNGAYIDPLLLLEPASVVDIVYLAPFGGAPSMVDGERAVQQTHRFRGDPAPTWTDPVAESAALRSGVRETVAFDARGPPPRMSSFDRPASLVPRVASSRIVGGGPGHAGSGEHGGARLECVGAGCSVER